MSTLSVFIGGFCDCERRKSERVMGAEIGSASRRRLRRRIVMMMSRM